MKYVYIILVLALVSGCQSSQKDAAATTAATPAAKVLPKTIQEAVDGPYRTPENRVRDQYRHPAETLAFFGLKPEMTVVEITPGNGWYLEILAPLMNEKGRYIAALAPSSANEYVAKMNEKVEGWLKANPEIDAKVTRSVFNPKDAKAEIAPAGTADMVVTFRNVHNWVSQNGEQAAFNAFFNALKPGGILGVVEHRADPKAKKDPKAKSGYIAEAEVIRLAEKAGFKLDSKSEINANPKDTKNHPEGVWTLPPVLKLGDKDREKYVAIGESDRMTLRFVKPEPKAKKK